MAIYTLHEGLFNRVNRKKLTKDELRTCEKFLNEIYKKHFSGWKRIVEDSFKNMSLVQIKLDSNANFEADRNSKDMYASVGRIIMLIDNNDIDTNINLDTNQCAYRLAEYNVKHNIKFVRFNFTKTTALRTGYDVWLHVDLGQVKHIACKNNVQESTIFDNVAFLDEGAAALAAIIGLSSVLIFAATIPKQIDKVSIKLAFKSYANKNKDVRELSKNISSVSKININKLISSVDINDNDIKTIKSNPVVAYAIYDKGNNIIAYALFTRWMQNYVFDICGNKHFSSEAKTYIKALFELEANVYGAGLKEVLKSTTIYKGIPTAYSNKENPDALCISRYEFNEIRSKMVEISSKLDMAVKSIMSKYKQYYDEEIPTDNTVNVNNGKEFTPIIDYTANSNLDSIDDSILNNDNNDVGFIAKCFERYLNSLGFETDRDCRDEYLCIDVYENSKYPNIGITIYIDYCMNIKYSIYYSRPIIIK